MPQTEQLSDWYALLAEAIDACLAQGVPDDDIFNHVFTRCAGRDFAAPAFLGTFDGPANDPTAHGPLRHCAGDDRRGAWAIIRHRDDLGAVTQTVQASDGSGGCAALTWRNSMDTTDSAWAEVHASLLSREVNLILRHVVAPARRRRADMAAFRAAKLEVGRKLKAPGAPGVLIGGIYLGGVTVEELDPTTGRVMVLPFRGNRAPRVRFMLGTAALATGFGLRAASTAARAALGTSDDASLYSCALQTTREMTRLTPEGQSLAA